MQIKKSYGQFCALARALDHVGDRWTLLIVRELLIGPRRFAELLQALPGIATNLLVARLRQLEADGIIERSDHPPRSPMVTYRLSALGRALEPAVFGLIRWGAAWMAAGPGGDRADARWAILALQALLDAPHFTRPKGVLKVEVGGEVVWVLIGADGRKVATGAPPKQEKAVVSGDFPAILALASGLRRPEELDVQIEGDRSFAESALKPGPGVNDG